MGVKFESLIGKGHIEYETEVCGSRVSFLIGPKGDVLEEVLLSIEGQIFEGLDSEEFVQGLSYPHSEEFRKAYFNSYREVCSGLGTLLVEIKSVLKEPFSVAQWKLIKFNSSLLSEWFHGWEDVSHPATILKRVWVLENLNRDEESEYKTQKHRFDTLLSFIEPTKAKQIREIEEGGTSQNDVIREGTGVRAGDNFLDDVESLRSRRDEKLDISPHDPYVESKRAGFKKEFKVSTGEISDKPIILTRRIIMRDKNASS